jgi:hypothetical protein
MTKPPDLARAASVLKEEGELDTAAEQYALAALARLVDRNFQHGRGVRLSIASVFESINTDIEAGNQRRARRIFELFEPIFKAEIQSVSDMALAGLLHEWYGDAYLMLEDRAALRQYHRSQSLYSEVDSPGRNWAFEEEFDYAFWAVGEFARRREYSLSDELMRDFHSRIESKIEIAEEMLKDD